MIIYFECHWGRNKCDVEGGGGWVGGDSRLPPMCQMEGSMSLKYSWAMASSAVMRPLGLQTRCWCSRSSPSSSSVGTMRFRGAGG